MDARVIAATNQNLEQAMAAGNFRRDLYYRLAQVRVHVPPLRERPDDVRPLASFFLEKQEAHLHLSERAMQALEQYGWPGNVRELRNVVVQAAVMANGELIEPEDLPGVVQSAPPRPITLEDLEREMILKVMTDNGGQQQRTADILGISLRTLSRKLKQYQEDGRRAQD